MNVTFIESDQLQIKQNLAAHKNMLQAKHLKKFTYLLVLLFTLFLHHFTNYFSNSKIPIFSLNLVTFFYCLKNKL